MFLRTKDEAPKIIIKFLKQAQASLNAIVRYLHTDNDTEFLNQTLQNYTEEVGITHHISTTRTPQQNGVVERRNRTFVEAARTMLIISNSPLFLWDKAVATACYTQNRSHGVGLVIRYDLPQEMESQLNITTLVLQQLQLEWSRFVTIVKQTINLDKESYHRLFDILKQYQKEVREICADKIARNANILALVAAAQQYPDTYNQPPKSHKSYTPPSKQSSSTRSYSTTRHKGKEIDKPITPPSESTSKEDSDLEQARKGKEMQKNLALIAKNQRTLTVAGARETIGNQEVVTEESRSHAEPLEKVQSDNEYNVFANERQYSGQPESINDTYVVEKVDSNVILSLSGMCDNGSQADQNAEEYDDERVVLANLIAN
ncbi:integrase, catalytic region, zinc finger, CCHC-type containing protein [Tanacetum coccineum]